jgi:hypothetical protein
MNDKRVTSLILRRHDIRDTFAGCAAVAEGLPLNGCRKSPRLDFRRGA